MEERFVPEIFAIVSVKKKLRERRYNNFISLILILYSVKEALKIKPSFKRKFGSFLIFNHISKFQEKRNERNK